MNCKPGDLAYVFASEKTSHIGMVVKVESLHVELTNYYRRTVWTCTFSGVVVGNNNEILVGEAACPDESLRPISGVPVHDEQLDEVHA